MTSTSTQPVPDFLKDLVPWMLRTFDEATRQVYRMIWNVFMFILVEHWVSILIILISLLVIATFRAFYGYWGMLGSLLYNYLYFGILFVVGLIKGPGVFVNEYFEAVCLVILYPLCYIAVGKILDKLGVRRRF